jgi:hypothetical protein
MNECGQLIGVQALACRGEDMLKHEHQLTAK